MSHIQKEAHRSRRIGWLRAVVLGANDWTISVASLFVGVAVSGAPQSSVLLTGVAGLVASAMSMAPGEYESVQSQADTELASAISFAVGAIVPIAAVLDDSGSIDDLRSAKSGIQELL